MPRDLRAHLHPQLRVEVRQRLVHEERLRVADDRATHRHALSLAAGERAGLHLCSESARPRMRAASRTRESISSFGRPRILRREAHVLRGVHVRVERVVLEDHRDVPVLRRQVVDDLAVELTFPDVIVSRRRSSAARCLPAARRADEHDELPVATSRFRSETASVPSG